MIDGLDPALECEVDFIDLANAPLSFEELRDRLAQAPPHIFGFSAILTHAYAYLKDLSSRLKEHFPGVVQVLGGQMSVMANILLQRTKIDFCVTGESEPAFSGLISRLAEAGFDLSDPRRFSDIKGLAFMSGGIPFFTGYAEPGKNGLLQMNYGRMAEFTGIEFFPKVTDGPYKNWINRHEIGGFYGMFFPENVHKRLANVVSCKGCVGRCSFCHRFFRGHSTLAPLSVIAHIEELIRTRDIGLIQFQDEHFGADKRKTAELVAYLRSRRLNWTVGGTRTDTISESTIREWKEAGCVLISFGIESCSRKMLDVMEKRTTVAQNLEALNGAFRNGVHTTVLLLIGMPGETEETIGETIRNLALAIPDDIDTPYEICINYFQAVPGTPGYEYARNVGLIGRSLDDEERYIENLYGVNANDIRHYLNFTDYEKEEVVYWKNYVFLELIVAYMKKHGLFRTLKRKKVNRYRYAAIYMLLPAGVRRFLLKYMMMLASCGPRATLRAVYRMISVKKKPFFGLVREPLRKVNATIALPPRPDETYTHILRGGR